LIIVYLSEGYDLIKQYDMSVKPYKFVRDLSFPHTGNCDDFNFKWDGADIFFTYTSWLQPTQKIHYNLKTHKYEVWHESKEHIKADLSNIVVEDIYYPAKDGTMIPAVTIRNKLILPTL
jgi:prolyl oligopeptidase PreP (S9A serine peptidase family)